MKKFIFGLIGIMFVSVMAFSLSSCSKEEVEPEKEEGDEPTILGTWRCEYGESYRQMTLEEDGIIIWCRVDANGTITSGPDYCTYTYENGNITSYEAPGDIEVIMHVETLSKTRMVTYNVNRYDGTYGRQYIWTRIIK